MRACFTGGIGKTGVSKRREGRGGINLACKILLLLLLLLPSAAKEKLEPEVPSKRLSDLASSLRRVECLCFAHGGK